MRRGVRLHRLRHVYELLSPARIVGVRLLNWCVWVKNNGGMGSLYRSRHEFIVVLKDGAADHINNVVLGRHRRNRSNVWEFPSLSSFGSDREAPLTIHPTAKPDALVEDALFAARLPGAKDGLSWLLHLNPIGLLGGVDAGPLSFLADHPPNLAP